jgi:hypothetical protein
MINIYKNIFTKRNLLIGDIFVLALITITGFATHGEIERVHRMLTTFIPFIIAWLIIAPIFGLFHDEITREANQLWRVLWAMIAVAPLAAWLRGLWLNTPILPIFVLVILGVSAPIMLLWRIIYLVLLRRTRLSYG